MQGVSQPAHSSTDVETHGCANGASNVKQTNRVLMETEDLSWYEVRPGQATHTNTHKHARSLTVRGSVMRAAWPFMPLLILCRGLCLVMGPMRKITSARLYIRHVFLSRRFLHKWQTKCWSCRLVSHTGYFKLYQIWGVGNFKKQIKKKRKYLKQSK